MQSSLETLLQQHGAPRRTFFISDIDGTIIAAAPKPTDSKTGATGRNLTQILGDGQPLTILGAGVLDISLADGTEVLATARNLRAPLGQIAITQQQAAALSFWRSETALTITLSATTGFVVLILGFAFHWQATRAREADVIYDMVRGRIDTALNRGRCGLWDWDLAR